MKSYILFMVGNSTYAISTEWVQQVEMVDKITPVPNTPAFVEGVVHLRGHVVPVVNLRTQFGLEKQPVSLRTRLLVVQMNGRVVGLLVDTAREFIGIEEDQILPLPEDLTGPGIEYLRGIASIGERLILVIELAQLLNREEKKALSQSLDAAEKNAENASERKSSYV
jgi:purine-binding chemotaxis protein CheW